MDEINIPFEETHVIYHDSCVDGFAAFAAVSLVIGDLAIPHPCQYGKRQEELDITEFHGKNVMIVDFSLPLEKLDNLRRIAKRVTWIDHHISAIAEFVGATLDEDNADAVLYTSHVYPAVEGHFCEMTVVLDTRLCGAYLTYQHLYPNREAPPFLEYVDANDRYTHHMAFSKEFHRGIWDTFPFSLHQFQQLLRHPEDVAPIISKGTPLERMHRNQVVQAIRHGAVSRFIALAGKEYSIGIVNCPPELHTSVGNDLTVALFEIGVCWNVMGTGRVKVGLRSRSVNVGRIAKHYGGGGHARAAGMELPSIAAMCELFQL